MIRVVLFLLLPTIAIAQNFIPGFDAGSSTVRQPSEFVVCAYGDSLTFAGKWFAPVVDAGITVLDIGFGGAKVRDPAPATPPSGDNQIIDCFTPLPCTVEGDQCRDIIGDSTIEAICLRETAQFCDVGTVMFGTNDASAQPVLPDFQAGLTAILDEFELRNIPVVLWRPIPRADSPVADDRIRDLMMPLIDAAIVASGYNRVTVVDAWKLYDNYESKFGNSLFLGLYTADRVHYNIPPNANAAGIIGSNLVGDAMLRAIREAVRVP